MKISCTKENLTTGLSIVTRVAAKNLTLPILGNVLLRATGGTLTLGATNLEVGVITRVRGKVTKEGSVTVQARLLNEFVSLLDDDRIELESDGTSLRVEGATSKTTIRGITADDFPIIPAVAHESGFRAPATTLHHGLTRVLFAAAQDATRPEISGIYVARRGAELTMAATDSYRLAEARLQLDGAGRDLTAIIPSRALAELARILPVEGQVELYLSDSQALFVTDGTELTTRLIEGQYPDYQQIIPESSQTQAVVDVETLTKAVKTASLFCKPGINDVTVELDPTGRVITCAAANAELGEHRGRIEAKVSGKPTSIVFNYRYLLDGLANLGTDSATLGVSDNASPGVLRPQNGGTYLYLLMPIRQ
ncbi:MAG: DNA polymerase III subunit beta [Candidatus Kerfeldbacteria bacterium]|nr:DNA polymerase III subunit beta [Candidatus Kerfeldbacteria bacterium]